MSSILWDKIVFGPIHSRRVGVSLGINIMPISGKVCSFDCIYCECGWNKDGKKNQHIPTLEEIENAIKNRFAELSKEGIIVNSISFTGNGEPTLHKNFPEIIDLTINYRNLYLKDSQISVFTNSTFLHKEEVRNALMKIDNPILKLDAGNNELITLINQPNKSYDIDEVTENMKLFNGNFIIQTLFLKGENNGKNIDNTNQENTNQWIKKVIEVHPREVMAYTLDRETPSNTLKIATYEEIEQITKPLVEAGIKVQINAPKNEQN
ncbi:MAG: radical SAM protein [Paludibacteraceae bacterium]|nr:radical SAM protein [Paludibacteraceae bacterium]